MARNRTPCILAALAVLLVISAPGALAGEEPAEPVGEPPDAGEAAQEAVGTVKQAADQVRDALPPPPDKGGSAGSGNGNNSSNDPPDAEATVEEAEGVIIRVYDRVDESSAPVVDETAKEADNAVALMFSAIGAMLAGALAGLFSSGSSSDGGSMGVSDFVVQTAQQSPLIFIAAVATTVGLVAGLAWLVRRLLPFGLAPLLSRIARDELYENDARRLVADLVGQNPGMSLHELVERTKYSRNAVSYHLFVLEKEEQISSVKDGKYRRYFPRDGKYVNGAKKVVSVLMNDTSRRIAQYVGHHPGAIQREVCEDVGTTPSATCWHAKRLETHGVIRKERDGNTVRYFPGPAVEKYDLGDFGLPSPAAA